MANLLTTFINSFNNRLNAPARQHLKNVYGCLSLSALSAVTGAYVHMYWQLLQGNLLTTLSILGFFYALKLTPDDGKNQKLRLAYLLGFAFVSGLGLGPLLELVIHIDPSIVVTALVGTTVVFVSFSISALLAERGRWLYLGGTVLSSMLNILLMLCLTNLFLQASILDYAQLYIGLFLMCGFVIYDTQLILEKHYRGSKDFISHSLDLFIDFFGIFRYLLVILTKKEHSKQQRKR